MLLLDLDGFGILPLPRAHGQVAEYREQLRQQHELRAAALEATDSE